MIRSLLFSIVCCIISIQCMTPNEKLIRCCETDEKIDEYCADKYCQVRMIKKDNVLPFIAECAPRGPTIGKIWDCITSRADHRKCCRRVGVSEHCMPFCNAEHAAPTDIAKYGICIAEFGKFQTCFARYLRNNPSIRGD